MKHNWIEKSIVRHTHTCTTNFSDNKSQERMFCYSIWLLCDRLLSFRMTIKCNNNHPFQNSENQILFSISYLRFERFFLLRHCSFQKQKEMREAQKKTFYSYWNCSFSHLIQSIRCFFFLLLFASSFLYAVIVCYVRSSDCINFFDRFDDFREPFLPSSIDVPHLLCFTSSNHTLMANNNNRYQFDWPNESRIKNLSFKTMFNKIEKVLLRQNRQ